MSNKPSLVQGTRDFDAATVRKRNYILTTIRTVFELYGYQPLETPAMENLDTLMGKYGEEGDKLIFKILNNGLSDPKNTDKAKTAFDRVLQGKNDKDLTERALRYDLTIPFARYVAMNIGKLTLPFKRYQIQPVWRADRPQKGRYREFYQCDADVVGSASLFNEVELALIYSEAFTRLKLPVEIKLNNRKILAALAELCGGADKMVDITVAIDKLDKIGLDQVKVELTERGLTAVQIAAIEQYLLLEGTNEQKLTALKTLFADIELGQKGIAELEYVLEHFSAIPQSSSLGQPTPSQQAHQSSSPVQPAPQSEQSPHSPLQSNRSSIQVDLTLARGLNYYTGTIFEIKAIGAKMGSIGGGGRYDDLTGLFGVSGIPGVGISFGVDRIYDVMEELSLFPEDVHSGTKVLFFNVGEKEFKAAVGLMQQLRSKGIPCEAYHEQAKFDKQFKYAEKKAIAFAVILGEQELAAQQVKLKDLRGGQQTTLSFAGLINFGF